MYFYINFRTIQEIKQPPHAKNVNFCPKCYCYICDKLAKEVSNMFSFSKVF